MKKTMKKIVALGSGAALLVSASVMGTMAYLTSQTKTVTNTFTVGNVVITLDEAPVDADGDKTTGNRVMENSYKLMPGHDYDKDPTVHVDAESEDAWLFVKVVDEIVNIQDTTTVAEQMYANGWTLVNGESNVYAYEAIVTGGNDYVVFETFKIKGDVKNDELAAYDGKTITVEAFAVQADGFGTSDEAWTAAKADWANQ